MAVTKQSKTMIPGFSFGHNQAALDNWLVLTIRFYEKDSWVSAIK